MSLLKLEYEILVSGIYPFEGEFEKSGFKIVKNTIDEKLYASLFKESVIYFSPFIGICCYPDSTGTIVYLTLRKEEYVNIDYENEKEYDVEVTNKYIESSDWLKSIEMFEKEIVLEVNNDIKFPIKTVKAYDVEGKFVACDWNFMRLNVPYLLNSDQREALEVIGRQNNRLASGISYKKIAELAENNKCFKTALGIYHSSFFVPDYNVGFVLLVTALEALLGLKTYSEPKKNRKRGQSKYESAFTICQNVSFILMDNDDTIRKRIRKLYDIRSKFVHEGKEIEKQYKQDMQEYVRKVLLMYWFVSLEQKTYYHKKIITKIQSAGYKREIMYQNFLTGLDNISFEEKSEKILKDTWMYILREHEQK